MRCPRILVVSASAGTGHVSAGEAMRQALLAAGAETEHVDVLDLAPRWVARAYAGSFEFLARRAPRVWRGVYMWSDGPDADTARWGPLARGLLFRGFRDRLRSSDWDYCLCTHFLPAQLAAGRAGFPPFGVIVTDYALHRYWVQPRVRHCFVGTPGLAAAAAARLPGVRIRATGIPIRGGFTGLGSAADARAVLGLSPDRPIALVIGGGLGIAVEEMTRAALSAFVPCLQVVAVCGRNADVRRRLEAAVPAGRVRTLGWVHDIERWMTAADVIVSKPGGLTTAEALAVGRPLVLTRALPGNEEANVATLEAAGAALACDDPTAVGLPLQRIFADPVLRLSLTQGARSLGAPHAARDIASAVLESVAARAAA